MSELVELCAIWIKPNGIEEVRTGIYVFDTVTISQIRDLMGCYADGGIDLPDKVEI